MGIFTKLSIHFKFREKYEAFMAGYQEGKKQGIKEASHVPEAALRSAERLGITTGREQVYAENPLLREYEVRIKEYDERAQAYIDERLQLKPPLLTPRLVAERAGFPTRQLGGILPLISTGELPKPPTSGPSGPLLDAFWQSSQPHEVVWAPIITDEAAQPQQVLDGEPTETSLLVRLRHER